MRKIITLVVALVFVVSVVAPAMAAVTPAPACPTYESSAAKTPAERKAAAEHHMKMAEYERGMVAHYRSLASEHERMRQPSIARHYRNLATLHQQLAREHAAEAKTYTQGTRTQKTPRTQKTR